MADNDYSGEILTMESFTSQTTDGSGDITVVLQNTPIADDAILVNLQGVAGAFAQFQSRTGTSVTFRVYQKYDKATSANVTLGSLPVGVTAQSTKQSTDSGTGTSGDRSSTGSVDISGAHTHGVSFEYTHTHEIDSTGTTLSALATTGSITLVVTYAY